MLHHEDSTEHNRAFERAGMTPIREVGQSKKPVAKLKHRGLRIGTWNFQGLCIHRKALERGEFLSKNHMDIGGQESWELDRFKLFVSG